MKDMCNFYANPIALDIIDMSICRFSHKLRSQNQFLADTVTHLDIVGLGLMIGQAQVVKSQGKSRECPVNFALEEFI